jgi:hypothetical protein
MYDEISDCRRESKKEVHVQYKTCKDCVGSRQRKILGNETKRWNVNVAVRTYGWGYSRTRASVTFVSIRHHCQIFWHHGASLLSHQSYLTRPSTNECLLIWCSLTKYMVGKRLVLLLWLLEPYWPRYGLLVHRKFFEETTRLSKTNNIV